jgi:hypothetical protein
MRRHAKRQLVFSAVAIVLAVASMLDGSARGDERRGFAALVQRAGVLVLEAARAEKMNPPFDSVVVGAGPDSSIDLRTWRILLDDAPSVFALRACQPWKGASEAYLCRVADGGTACSFEGIRNLAAIEKNDLPAACGGSFSRRTHLDPDRLEAPPIGLIYVLAHELGHILNKHDAAAQPIGLRVAGTTKERIATFRQTLSGVPAALRQEREADAVAGRITSALIARSADKNEAANRAYVIQHHTNALRMTFTCIDEATRCLWVDEPSLPPDPDRLDETADKLLCAVVSAPAGSLFPVLRGTHQDWGMRMTTVQALGSGPQGRGEGEAPLSTLVANVDDIFKFWEQHAESYYEQLAVAVGNRAGGLDKKVCARSPRRQGR